jgi:uncharacterized protein YndB with AHSA1/START domain
MSDSTADKVVVERVLSATPERVFQALTRPEELRVFLCAHQTTVGAFEADIRVGGRFLLVMRDGARDVEHRGEFKVIDPPRKLAFSWISVGTGGNETLVTIELAPAPKGTVLRLVHDGLPRENVASHQSGWTTIVEKLDSHLSRADFMLELHFDATPERVYQAIATRDGVRGWWTELCELDERVGGRAEFRFPKADFFAVARVAALEPDRRVEWQVTDSKHPATSGYVDMKDWIGTSVRFELEPDGPKRTRLRFAHVGLQPLECATTCRSVWSFFLAQSLRGYLETGKGEPATD